MELIASRPRLTNLLENDELARVERLRLNPNRRFTNRSQGEHLAGKGGSSTEFSDYRDYVPGDDVRYVDWNIFARLHRPYIKLYQFEEEMHIVILVDASSSMLFDEKLGRAKQLAAAFAVMGLMNMEKVSVFACHQTGQRPALLPPCTGRVSMKRVFEFLERIEGGGHFPVDEAIETVLRLHRGRGIAVLLSDFLTLGDLQRPMNMLFSAGLEIFGLQILGPSEIDPEVTGDLRFVDAENGWHPGHYVGWRSTNNLPRSAAGTGGASGFPVSKAQRTVPIDQRSGLVEVGPIRPPSTTRVGTMSWPGFYALSGAWLFLLLVPLLVMYFLKLKRPRMEIPSLALWQQVINDQRVNSPFQKFKRNLLLLLQLLLLLALILAAMQPFMRSGAERAQYLPVLIDCSASMAALDKPGGTNRLDVAKQRVEQLIDDLLPDQRVSLIAVSGSAQRLTSFTDNKRLLRDALRRAEVRDVPSELEDALRMTQALTRTVPIESVLIFSDGNLPSTVDFELPFEINYQQVPVGAANIGITALNARRTKAGQWNVFVRLESSAHAAATKIELRQGDTLVAEDYAGLEASSAERLVFRVTAPTATRIDVRLSPDGVDSLASDNFAAIQLPEARQLAVYCEPELEAFRHALEAIPDVDIYPSSDGAAGRSQFDLLIASSSVPEGYDTNVQLLVGHVPTELEKLVTIQEGNAGIVDWRRNSTLLQHVQLSEVVFSDEPASLPEHPGWRLRNAGI